MIPLETVSREELEAREGKNRLSLRDLRATRLRFAMTL
jgi:hypothetical protein